MTNRERINSFFLTEYHGRILRGSYSKELKKHLSSKITKLLNFDEMGTPAIPYISAWQEGEPFLWHEFTGQDLIGLLDCEASNVAEGFRSRIIDRCIYRNSTPGASKSIVKEVTTKPDLGYSKVRLRNEVKQRGGVEAVYKIAAPNNQTIWLKDQSSIEVFRKDNICLCTGLLFEVTKEMRAEEELKKAQDELQEHKNNLEEMVLDRTKELQQTQLEIVTRLAKAAEFRDNCTGQHITKMSHYCATIGQKIGIKKPLNQLLFQASPMHDVGKIGIPDRILLKPGKLNNREQALMKKHSRIGAELLNGHDSNLLKVAKNIALTHHEKWNGSGYPQGLTGKGIPLAGRIVAMCDVFDALTSARPYKNPWSFSRAVQEIKQEKGHHFDPRLVDAFMDSIPEIKEIYYTEKSPTLLPN